MDLALDGARRAEWDRHDADAWLAWHISVLPKQKRMPKLKTLLAKREKPGRPQTPAEMTAVLDGLVIRTGGEITE